MGYFKKHLSLNNKRKLITGKAGKIFSELDVLPLVSVIKCEGSKTREGCSKPLFTNVKMKNLRDDWIYKLENEGNAQNKLLSVELRTLCFICILEHPGVNSFLGKTEKRLLKVAKRIGA